MEEPRPVQDPPNLQNLPVQNPDPNSNSDLHFTAPSDPPPPQPQPAAPPPPPAAVPTPSPPPVLPESKKRSLDNFGPIQECRYFKMRAVVKDIRPHFLEMLRTVDFQSCKVAEELKQKLKLLMELYMQMTAEKLSTTNCKTAPNPGENGVGLKPQEQLHDTADQSRPGQVFAKPSEKQQAEHSQNQGTHIVGGSAFGWNFITFTGSMPIYYGRTKESFRAAHVTL
ncbi:PREDICTED: pre-mRNA-splicing ATP-dependent RNA helicase prp28 [Populus euphratica]|uniref:Pre-mRNA-splicing ATP-dependent RNA helicase prp28 n=1 Tax=Populus euphratica TaxID=75702 RepID=A0AAJ6U6A5_POPEU|nr:PREDICTED: pre-mRNA-splicing ATP-dependent RNA helicase prp28 [Populus euphratica]XP_011023356.1 PREDICTED: pre-mRNA-splicing ATP-dependent RNA helicase prp28 [Populus euphratica]